MAWPPSSNALDLIANTLGFFAIVCFAFPAMHANKYGRLVSRLENSRVKYDSTAIERAKQETLGALDRLKGEWAPWKGRLLIIGTFLAGLSYLVEIVKLAI